METLRIETTKDELASKINNAEVIEEFIEYLDEGHKSFWMVKELFLSGKIYILQYGVVKDDDGNIAEEFDAETGHLVERETSIVPEIKISGTMLDEEDYHSVEEVLWALAEELGYRQNDVSVFF